MMNETDKQFLDRIAGAMSACFPNKVDLGDARTMLRAALLAAQVDPSDFRRLASGDYILCDGYCQGSYDEIYRRNHPF